MCPVSQSAEAGNMIGVQMRIDCFDELKIQLLQELDISVNLFEHRIDDECLPTPPAGKEIAVGAGNAIEHLSEDHVFLSSDAFMQAPPFLSLHCLNWHRANGGHSIFPPLLIQGSGRLKGDIVRQRH
jgi:hypothetical protein